MGKVRSLVFLLIGAALAPAGLEAASPDARVNEYAEIFMAAQDWYADEVAPERLIYGSIDGMLGTLDPHTTFFRPRAFGALQQKQRGAYYGLGLTISQRGGKVVIIGPVEGPGVERHGLIPGDLVTRIGGEPTEGMSSEDVANRLRGPQGTPVTLTVLRPGRAEPFEVTAKRSHIATDSVAYALLLENRIGYIRLTDFTNTSNNDFIEAWNRLKKQGMAKLVLDLRGNPGGVLDAALGISGGFLKKGEKIVETRGRLADSNQTFVAAEGAERSRIPIVVLVNNGSASASEIVAGALQDHDRGLIVGTTTWGKGLVQSVFNLDDGAGVAITTARYYTPSGRCIQRDYQEPIEYFLPTFDGEPEEGAGAPDAGKVQTFKTDAGRIVKASGGITPDVVVKPARLSEAASLLYADGAFFDFAVNYKLEHPNVTQAFRPGPGIREAFFRFVEERKTLEPGDLKAARENPRTADEVDRGILEEILNVTFGREEGYRSVLETDNQLQKALTLFPEAEKLVARRKPKPAPQG